MRYKQTALGAAWAFIQPFVTMIVFTLVLHRIGKVKSHTIPYPILSYSALVVWYFFAGAVTQSSLSLVGNSSMLRTMSSPAIRVARSG